VITWMLLACAKPGEITVLEGFDYGWDGFNHRLSYLEAGIDGSNADLAVVGGTSTTGVERTLPESCDPDACQEFPFTDTAQVDVLWGRLTANHVAMGVAEIELYADSAGTTQTVTVPVDGVPVIAVIEGLVVDTDHALPDDSPLCYDPALGWHPRRIAVSLGNPVAGDGSATVDVTAAFEAGNSLEPERACVDAVNELATAAITVRVAVLAGDLTAVSQDLDQSASYTYGDRFSPDEQPPPDPATRPLDGDPATDVFGWTALDFRFHPDDPDDRGAYLRTLELHADGTTGEATGHATNYSPATQLSGFDYAFTGTVEAISAPGATADRGTVGADLPAALDADGTPVVTTLPLESAPVSE
jgi:hypothetical protein